MLAVVEVMLEFLYLPVCKLNKGGLAMGGVLVALSVDLQRYKIGRLKNAEVSPNPDSGIARANELCKQTSPKEFFPFYGTSRHNSSLTPPPPLLKFYTR